MRSEIWFAVDKDGEESITGQKLTWNDEPLKFR